MLTAAASLEAIKRHPREFWVKAGLLLLALLAIGLGLRMLGQHVRFGFDFQEEPCLPWRAYMILPVTEPLGYGQMVALRTAKMRPATSQDVVKIVQGVPGDRVRIVAHVMYLNDRELARLYTCDKTHKAEYCDDREYVIPSDGYVVMGNSTTAFDSRYWGVLSRNEIVGRVTPIF